VTAWWPKSAHGDKAISAECRDAGQRHDLRLNGRRRPFAIDAPRCLF